MNFVALDVETANADMASICQIGIARFADGKLIEEWSSLIDPEDYFCPINISIHGIKPTDVKGKPKFPEVFDVLERYMGNTVCVCHTHFDRVSIAQAIEKHNLNVIDTIWLDSARVARRTWNECAWKGYGLKNVCKIINYEFNHHDALEDAKASGQIILSAVQATGLDLDAWLHRINKPIDPTNSSCGSAVHREGNPEGALYGDVVVFTGALEIPRKEAADLASSIGCTVNAGVTQNTTILVVGNQDLSKLAGKKKSSKHLKTEKLISEGQNIRIIKESDFKELVKYSLYEN